MDTCILVDACIMDTSIMDISIMDTSIMDTTIRIKDTCMTVTAWVTRYVCPKGAKDEVKQARRA